jgi:hypothetical protein
MNESDCGWVGGWEERMNERDRETISKINIHLRENEQNHIPGHAPPKVIPIPNRKPPSSVAGMPIISCVVDCTLHAFAADASNLSPSLCKMAETTHEVAVADMKTFSIMKLSKLN